MADRTQSDLSPTVDDDSKRFLKKAEVEDATVPDVEVGSPPTPCSGSPNISYSLASLPSTLMFTWMKPLLELGKTKPLDVEDLYELLPQVCSGEVWVDAAWRGWRAPTRPHWTPTALNSRPAFC